MNVIEAWRQELNEFDSLMQQLDIDRETFLAQPSVVCVIGIGLTFGERVLFGDYKDGKWVPHTNVQGIWACDGIDLLQMITKPSMYARLHNVGVPVLSVQSFQPVIPNEPSINLCHAPFAQAAAEIQQPFFDIVTFCRIKDLTFGLSNRFFHDLNRVVKPGGFCIATGSVEDPNIPVPAGWRVLRANKLRSPDLTLVSSIFSNYGYVLQKDTNLTTRPTLEVG